LEYLLLISLAIEKNNLGESIIIRL